MRIAFPPYGTIESMESFSLRIPCLWETAKGAVFDAKGAGARGDVPRRRGLSDAAHFSRGRRRGEYEPGGANPLPRPVDGERNRTPPRTRLGRPPLRPRPPRRDPHGSRRSVGDPRPGYPRAMGCRLRRTFPRGSRRPFRDARRRDEPNGRRVPPSANSPGFSLPPSRGRRAPPPGKHGRGPSRPRTARGSRSSGGGRRAASPVLSQSSRAPRRPRLRRSCRRLGGLRSVPMFFRGGRHAPPKAERLLQNVEGGSPVCRQCLQSARAGALARARAGFGNAGAYGRPVAGVGYPPRPNARLGERARHSRGGRRGTRGRPSPRTGPRFLRVARRGVSAADGAFGVPLRPSVPPRHAARGRNPPPLRLCPRRARFSGGGG
ncbi:MAG: putative ABC transporter ATP-binding protein [Brockia lithotrophica]|uniref:Putative ABC transporter ATP-binding protein n=1 Tax=Brockia lithotrophica TaxID=933949 RepID=A0A2T5G7C5_9BACL|nr:MAG: putative ABC transporter ATP-binding protein [Brockia lithotrophica]